MLRDGKLAAKETTVFPKGQAGFKSFLNPVINCFTKIFNAPGKCS